jgi:hypothetical protein
MTHVASDTEGAAMRGKLMFLGGLAAGFVLGSRAGRQAYEELVQTAKKVKESPTVQEAAGVVQAQATKVYEQGKDKLANTRLGDKLMQSEPAKTEPVAVGTTSTKASTTPTSGSTTGSF